MTNIFFIAKVILKEITDMPATLKDAVNSLKSLKISATKPQKISDDLLGKYEGIIPAGKTASEFIKDLRRSSYGKFRE